MYRAWDTSSPSSRKNGQVNTQATQKKEAVPSTGQPLCTLLQAHGQIDILGTDRSLKREQKQEARHNGADIQGWRLITASYSIYVRSHAAMSFIFASASPGSSMRIAPPKVNTHEKNGGVGATSTVARKWLASTTSVSTSSPK